MPGFVTMVFYNPIETIESGYTISLREDQPFGNVKCTLARTEVGSGSMQYCRACNMYNERKMPINHTVYSSIRSLLVGLGIGAVRITGMAVANVDSKEALR